MQFAKLLDKTLKWEGGFSEHPADTGGATKYGITLGTLKALNMNVDEDADIDAGDVKALSHQQVMDIYQREYFHKPKIHRLPEALQPVVFDMAVNHGPRRAIRLLQHTLNQTGLCQSDEDGLMGPLTASRAQQAYQQMGHYLINAICDERQNFYQRFVTMNPGQHVFMTGWTNRNNDFRIGIA